MIPLIVCVVFGWFTSCLLSGIVIGGSTDLFPNSAYTKRVNGASDHAIGTILVLGPIGLAFILIVLVCHFLRWLFRGIGKVFKELV